MIDNFELLWNIDYVQQEIKDVFGSLDLSLWSLDAGTKGRFKEHLEAGLPVDEFYREEIGFAYQPAWNTTNPGSDERGKAMAARQVFLDHGSKAVIDWGAGIGTIAVPLAMAGIKKVTAVEICLPCIEMLKHRKKVFGLDNLQIVDIGSSSVRAKFDGLVCTEVFEHVEEPDKLAALLDKRLRPGSPAVLSWSFVDMPTHLPEHIEAGLQHSHPDLTDKEGFGKLVLVDQLGWNWEKYTWFNNQLWWKPEEEEVEEPVQEEAPIEVVTEEPVEEEESQIEEESGEVLEEPLAEIVGEPVTIDLPEEGDTDPVEEPEEAGDSEPEAGDEVEVEEPAEEAVEVVEAPKSED